MIDIPTVNYPKPWLLFWVADVLAAGYFYYALYRKWQGWSRGITRMPKEKIPWGRVVRIWLSEVLGQRQLWGLSSFRWVAHLFIFWGFIALSLLSLSSFILKRLGDFGMDSGLAHFFFQEEGYLFIKLWGNGFGVLLLMGLMIAGVRRLFIRPPQQSNNQTDLFLIFFLFWLTLSGFTLEGIRVSLIPQEIARYSFFGQLFMPGGIPSREEVYPWLTACWVVHAFSGIALFVYLPHSKLMHSILAPLVIAMNAVEEHERKDLYWPDISKHRATRSPRD